MLDLFIGNTITRNIRISNPKLEYWIDRLRKTVEKVIDYYSLSSLYVDRPNPLINFIQALDVKTTMDEIDLTSIVDNNAKYLVKQFDFTSNLNKGKKHKNVIFKNTEEYFLITDKFNISDLMELKTEDLNPIKILYHEKNDMVLNNPTRTKLTKDIDDEIKPVIIYEIELNKLVTQYYKWCKEQEILDRDKDPARYLGTIVFPELLIDFNNMSLLNIVIDLWYNNLPNITIYKTVIDTISDSNINHLLKELFNLVNKLSNNNNLYYRDLLANIPLLDKNAYEFLKLDLDTINLNNFWLIVMSRIDIIIWLLSIEDLRRLNKDFIEDVKYFIKRYGKKSLTSLISDSEVEENVKEKIKDLENIVRSL